ncbi:uncharacterized protein LOC121382620 [Gigantopelta aegis]|uniref:uncharacterized protein LOC121382620 n=1 Tax=Gigantopelta aegis TaxID=1735272 RepID=UPI001B888595|nr:uncharacterized protein LOC121382620 [Gigantopelta aegis]
MWRLYRKHAYNMNNQFSHYRHLRKKLKPTECFIHVDFSENFVGKMSKEIQSMHFGASQPQITLHTGFYETVGMERPVCFSSVSNSLEHGPAAIWAHLDPVLEDIKQNHPTVTHLHFYSDGPTTQYRQKCNFYMLSSEIYEKGFQGATWNFHEAGHGKGIPDGVGGTLKQTANRKVRHGTDIMHAEDFVTVLQKACPSVKLFPIKPSNISAKELKIKALSLKTVPGTMKIHQIVTTCPYKITYSGVSCTCLEETCTHHKFQTFTFPKPCKQQNEEQQPKTRHAQRKQARKKRPSNTPSNQLSNKSAQNDTEDYTNLFENYLKSFQRCKTYSDLEALCSGIHLPDITGSARDIRSNGLIVDYNSNQLCPSDVPGDSNRFPVSVKANGECLPATGSVFAFGNDNSTTEIRTRIVLELVQNKPFYLDESNLTKGMPTVGKPANTIKAFAMYSGEYIPGIHLTERTIETISEQEVLKSVKPKTYMGIWQMCALSSVLHMPVFSVYPQLGNPQVRKDLHRQIQPRQKLTDDVAYIMWTSTRTDMRHRHWVPNRKNIRPVPPSPNPNPSPNPSHNPNSNPNPNPNPNPKPSTLTKNNNGGDRANIIPPNHFEPFLCEDFRRK